MSDLEITHNGARYPVFIPCLEGRCPERMQLHYLDRDPPEYKCMRRHCHFHENPRDARELAHWHRKPEGKRKVDPTKKESWETAI